MQNANISSLFELPTIQWGLRGDPYLWNEMKMQLADVAMPASAAELKQILENEFQAITGHAVDHHEHFVVDRFRGGGMSSGMVSPVFWQGTAIPLLLSRYNDLATKMCYTQQK